MFGNSSDMDMANNWAQDNMNYNILQVQCGGGGVIGSDNNLHIILYFSKNFEEYK